MNSGIRLYISRKFAVSLLLLGLSASSTILAQAPAPFGLTPNSRQIEYFHREQQAFIHFNMNTFTNVEWGDGSENENLFKPTDLNCGQWMRAFKAAGFTTAILTIKHHDGFCLWPSAYTKHSVKYDTAWRNGTGDVLREFTDSCHKYGIKAGIYLSPWDMHQSATFHNGVKNPNPEHLYGTDAYTQYYANQLVELMKNKPYGPLYEIWWDGAGYDLGLKATDFRIWADTIHRYMPECILEGTRWAGGVAEARYNGSEGGISGDPCWPMVDTMDLINENSYLNSGRIDGKFYIAPEADVSIRSGWYYHPNESPKSLSTVWDLYFTTVARNSVWLPNFPPDKRGWIPSADSTVGAGLGSYLYGTFSSNLLAGGTATANHTRGSDFDPKFMLDSSENTYFATTDGNNTDTIVFTPKSSITFDCIMLQEVIKLGIRTLNWSVDAFTNNAWTTISVANNKQCIGHKRAVKWSPATTATQVRLRITAGRACPAIHTFGVYKQTQVVPPSTWNGLPPIKENSTAVSPDRAVIPSRSQNVLRIAGDRIVLPANFGSGPVVVSIIDMQGHCVRRVVARRNASEARIGVFALKAGSYLVRCSNGKQTIEQKMINSR